MKLLLLVATCAVLAGSLFAQGQTINKAETITVGAELQLGMSQDAVFSSVKRAGYHVMRLGNTDDWFVTDGAESPEVFGQLTFANGALITASRSWADTSMDGFSLGQAIYGALTALSQEGKYSCVTETWKSRAPTNEHTYIQLYCGGKRLKMTLIDVFSGPAKGHHFSVHEILTSENTR
jgi:hypothetical protein